MPNDIAKIINGIEVNPPVTIAKVITDKILKKYTDTIIKNFLLFENTAVTQRKDITVIKEIAKLKTGLSAYSGYGKLDV